MKRNKTINHENPPLQQGAVIGCPYLSAQLAILKELERIAKLPPTKTFKGTFIRTVNCLGLMKQISELEQRKRGSKVVPDFEKQFKIKTK